MASPAPIARDVGRALRRARQRQHVELEEAARETRIARKFLEALETNAPLDAYPAPVYARAFLREYATFLGVDPEPLVASFRTADPAPEPVLAVVREVVPPPARWPARVLLAISICVVFGLAVYGVMAGRIGRNPSPAVAAGPSHPAAEASPAPTAAPSPASPHHRHVSGILATIHLSGRCWVQAVADGTTLYRGTLLPGQSRALHAKTTLQLTLGNAGAAQLMVDGARVSTAGTGQVMHLTITVRHGRARVQRM